MHNILCGWFTPCLRTNEFNRLSLNIVGLFDSQRSTLSWGQWKLFWIVHGSENWAIGYWVEKLPHISILICWWLLPVLHPTRVLWSLNWVVPCLASSVVVFPFYIMFAVVPIPCLELEFCYPHMPLPLPLAQTIELSLSQYVPSSFCRTGAVHFVSYFVSPWNSQQASL